MDSDHFDGLVRDFRHGASRRRLLAGLLGATVAGSLGRSDSTAKAKRQRRVQAQDDSPKPNGKKCVQDGQCQSGQCCRAERAKHGTCSAADCTPPTCSTQLISGPPAQAILTVQDTGSGLASIVAPPQGNNVDTPVPLFDIATTDPVVVTSTKINQTEPAEATIRVTDVAGNVTVCSAKF